MSEHDENNQPLQVKIIRAAYLLDCSERTVDRLCKKGELRDTGRGTRLRRIELASIIEYIARHQHHNTQEESDGTQ
jgi:hypothetical protein